MKNIHPSCPDCRVEMAEYYVGLVPIGVFLSLDKVTTYICRGCGRIIFYAKEFSKKLARARSRQSECHACF
jgi:hypothetical protein